MAVFHSGFKLYVFFLSERTKICSGFLTLLCRWHVIYSDTISFPAFYTALQSLLATPYVIWFLRSNFASWKLMNRCAKNQSVACSLLFYFRFNKYFNEFITKPKQAKTPIFTVQWFRFKILKIYLQMVVGLLTETFQQQKIIKLFRDNCHDLHIQFQRN